MSESKPGKSSMRRRLGLAALLAFALDQTSVAYESDVHYGLTKWLATEAGFNDWQAIAIAVGNYRVDSGTMQYMDNVLENACVGKFQARAEKVLRDHYPSDANVRSASAKRQVVAGSSSARAGLVALLEDKKPGAAQLGLFGNALHPLQDSFAHEGTPTEVELGAGIHCLPALAVVPGFPAAATGPHSANLTSTRPATTIDMAKATYEVLLRYPAIDGIVRTPKSWDSLKEDVGQFARATTKEQKGDWFKQHGTADIGFLEGISLPDGKVSFSLISDKRSLPDLQSLKSGQTDARPDLKQFFDGFITQWLGAEPPDKLGAMTESVAETKQSADDQRSQLLARLKLWKIRDHGAVAHLAHAAAPLSEKQLRDVVSYSARSDAYIASASPTQALLPMIAKGEVSSPILAYVTRDLTPGSTGRPRGIAILRFRHAPYDTVGLIAELNGSTWKLRDLVAAIDQ